MTPVHHAINYVEITVTDMAAAQHFYGTAFGWRFTDYAPAYAGIQAPEGDGEVGGLSLGPNVEPGGPLVLLYSDDLDATVAAVKDAGGTIAEEPYHSRAGGASPSSTRAGTGSAYGAQPRQHAGSGGAIRENADSARRWSSNRRPYADRLPGVRGRNGQRTHLARCATVYRAPGRRARSGTGSRYGSQYRPACHGPVREQDLRVVPGQDPRWVRSWLSWSRQCSSVC